MAKRQPRLSANVHLLSSKIDKVSANVNLQSSTNDQVDATPAPRDFILSEYMWNQTATLRQKALETYFVQGIGDGTLNPTAFGGYMVQDSVYCYLAKGSIDIAAGRATQENLKQYLTKESASYEEYYTSLWQKWHIANANGIYLGDACKAYADYERSVASDMDTIYFIVSMIPCLKLWPWLGQRLQGESHGVYTDWFNANFDPTYKGYEKLDAFVDAAQQMGTIDKDTATKVYTRCMAGEYAFFDSPKDMC